MLLESSFGAIEREGQVIDIAFDDVIKHAPYTLIYFFPKNFSPVCGRLALSLAEHAAELETLWVMIIGISRDPLEKLQKFRNVYSLPFLLIGDTDGILHEKFQVFSRSLFTLGQKKVRRTSFLLSQEGEIVHEWRKIRYPEKHGQEVHDFVLTFLANLPQETE